MHSQMKEKEGNAPCDYFELGYKSALESKCSLSALDGYLDGVSDLVDTGNGALTRNEIVQVTSELKQESENLKEELLKQQVKTASIRDRVDRLDNEIEAFDNDRIKFLNNRTETSGQFFAFAIGAVITLLLTLYLFLFYSSTGFSTIYGIPDSGDSIFNVDVFADASIRGGSAFGFVLLFPVVFLAVGFAMHIFYDRYKISKQRGEKPDFRALGMILITTFFADAIIGYKIASDTYMRAYMQGAVSETWKFDMIYSDSNFYLILLLGFATYVIWGFLLNYVLSHPYLNAIHSSKNRMNEVEEARKNLVLLSVELKNEEDELTCLRDEIRSKKMALNELRIGNTPTVLMWHVLKKSVKLFMEGYDTFFLTIKKELDQGEEMHEQIKRKVEAWLELRKKSILNPNEL